MVRLGLRSWTLGCLALLVAVLAAAPSSAGVPGRVLVEGLLTSTGGGPAADGKYAMTFRIYGQAQGGAALWQEAAQSVDVANGSFSAALGATAAIDPALLANNTWLGLQVGEDPELTRKPLASVFLALRAAVAENLSCTGCVTEAMLDPKLVSDLARKSELSNVATSGKYADLQGTPDLSGFAQTASLADIATTGAYADLTGTPKLAKVATTGAYADLASLPTLPELGKACGTGLVVKGLKADGSYECVQAFDAASVPKDLLDEVSNGLLTNQFNEVAASTKTPIEITDNNPVGISDLIEVPDFGTAQALTVTADIANSDTTNLVVNLIDPAGTKFVLWSKSAKGTAVKTTWPTDTKTVSGDLTTWVGKNPKGKWYLEVIDTAFLNNAKDGALKSWSIQVQVMASSKVGVGGGLVLKNGIEPPYACGATVAGSLYFDTKIKAVRYCDGAVWRNLADSCGNGLLDANEECDDGNNADGDGCSSVCVASTGYAKSKPGSSCLDVLTKAKAEALTPKSGAYWIKIGAGNPFQVYCNMVDYGGGWTLVLKAGIGADLASVDRAGAFDVPAVDANQPNSGVLQKISDANINLLRKDSGAAIGYWVTTPGSGTGKYGAEIFHRSDCVFKMNQTQTQVRATTCHQWTISYADSASWSPGFHWNANDAMGYSWAFGYANTGSCYQDGRDLGTHEGAYSPFHRGWCSTQAWGMVYAR
ncbi:MAG: fibrinogen-like YCDxxxxGGGW domain-containing protein [Myxococcota bacterium]